MQCNINFLLEYGEAIYGIKYKIYRILHYIWD